MSKVVASALLLLVTLPSAATGQAEKKPEFGFSAAGVKSGRTVKGPLYKKVAEDFSKVAGGGQTEFDSILIKGAKARYYSDISLGPKAAEALFSRDLVKAMIQSCIGPYSYDEGASWVQLSWVCRTGTEWPISKLIKFRDSPEISFTIWFEGGRIKDLTAMEPLPYPGAKRFVMNAADKVP